MCELYTVCLLLIFLFVDCYYNNSILWSKYPKNLWRWPPSSSLPPHLQSQLPLPLCLFTTAEPWQQRHRGYYGCYNVKVDRKVASPVLFFFSFMLFVLFTFRASSRRFLRAAVVDRSRRRRPAKLVWLSTPPLHTTATTACFNSCFLHYTNHHNTPRLW